MWVEYNPNPDHAKRVGDCTVRALSKALNTDWDTAFLWTVVIAFHMKDMQNANSVWGEVLHRNGFERYNLPTDCPNCYTVKDFCRDHPHGTFVLGTGSHAVCVKSGNYYDAWDSGDEIVSYIWYRKE